jgi:multisubunit Na+/H+ antiporter MnhC subunit
MSVPFIMVLAMGVLFAAGIYLMLERSLTRVLLGFILLGNGVEPAHHPHRRPRLPAPDRR